MPLGTGQRQMPEGSQRALAGSGAPKVLKVTTDSPEPRTWRLWFAARPTLPPALRPTGKNGKPKRSPPVLPPNVVERSNLTWPAERALIGYWRLLAKTVAGYADIPRLQRARISGVVYRRAIGVADEDNDKSRLKPLVDGLRDAGVIKNDTRQFVEFGPVTEERAGADGIGLLLIVDEIDPQ